MTVLGRTLWHASRDDIARPTMAGRTPGENHANSGLGIFCATLPRDYISGFGAFIYELELRSDLRVLNMTVREMGRMGHNSEWAGEELPSRAWFEAKGRQLALDYDLIALAEIDGTIEQAIVLNDEAIAMARQLSREEFEILSAALTDTPKGKRPVRGPVLA